MAIGITLAAASAAHAQDTSQEEMKARLDRLEKQNQDLMQMLQSMQQSGMVSTQAQPGQVGPPPVQPPVGADQAPGQTPSSDTIKKVVNDVLKANDEAKKAEAAKKAEDGYVVGDNTDLKASWGPRGLVFQSADGAFLFHLGGRINADNVWFTQSPALKSTTTQTAAQAKAGGTGPGIGDLQDGSFIRRARIIADGQIWGIMEYKIENDLENFAANDGTINFDEVFIGFKDLPILDTVRIGQMHMPFGLEAYTSSRFLEMLERSTLFDTYYTEFAPGIFQERTYFNQRMTTELMFSRNNNFQQFNGDAFGDGQYMYTARISGLPIWENDGRCLLHLALDYQYKKGGAPNDFNGGTTLPSVPPASITTNNELFRFRARQEIRDAIGIQGDANRLIDTGNIIAQGDNQLNAELLFYYNSFWLQSEACVSQLNNAVFPATSGGVGHGTPTFWGYYVMAGYFLTGEQRGYDKRFGRYDRVVPNENFFWTWDENHHSNFGLGALELTYRYSFNRLDSDGITGGDYGEHTFGINWYLNPNIKFQANVIYGQRTALPVGVNEGSVRGAGVVAAIEF